MLTQVKSGFLAGSVSRGPPAPTFVGSSTSADSANISMPGGIASGDIGVFLDYAFDSPSIPTDTLPSGWTRIGTTQTDTEAGPVGARLNMAYKELDGTETTLTGMAAGIGCGKIVLVFRKDVSLTWGTPADVEAQVELSSGGASAKTINVGASPLIVIGFAEFGGVSEVPMSPVETATFTAAHGVGFLNAGYIIYGSGAVDNVIDPSSEGDAQAIGGFYIPLT
jgi:hypothetical protein